MLFRKERVNISEECMGWLEKSGSFIVKQEQAKAMYDKRCAEIQDDVLRAVMTVSKEPASTDGKAEVMVEVRLEKSEAMNVMVIVTRVYAVVYTRNKRKYYVMLDEQRRAKKSFKIGTDIAISINGDDFVEVLKNVEIKTYRISM
ncbi:MAG: hypothetical protein IKL55_05555 [Clostridia bacterium]|nr:hypothetical protein [Clostridia bacterium]